MAAEPNPLVSEHNERMHAEEVEALLPETGDELPCRRTLVTDDAEQLTGQQGDRLRAIHELGSWLVTSRDSLPLLVGTIEGMLEARPQGGSLLPRRQLSVAPAE